jgi:hypothetical protein
MSDNERREELRRFLKVRRAQLRPSDVGLPTTARRRVRGLRREEVAWLAGIGLSWYTALENGDAHGVSEMTLSAVAHALRFSESEQEYLSVLVRKLEPEKQWASPSPLVLAAINANAFPSYVITGTWQILACNDAFRRVWGIGDHELPFNAVDRLFMDPAARKMHGENFIANISPVIAMLHSSQGRRPEPSMLRQLRDRLLKDDAIRQIWDDYKIIHPRFSNTCTIESLVGTFRYETLNLNAPTCQIESWYRYPILRVSGDWSGNRARPDVANDQGGFSSRNRPRISCQMPQDKPAPWLVDVLPSDNEGVQNGHAYFRHYGRAARRLAAPAGGQGPTPIAKRRLRWRQDRQTELHARGADCEQAYHRSIFNQVRRTRRPQRDDCRGSSATAALRNPAGRLELPKWPRTT